MLKILAFILFLAVFPSFCSADVSYRNYSSQKEKASEALSAALKAEMQQVFIYKDFADTENNYTQKAKIYGFDPERIKDLDENWQDNPYSGYSCIRCEQDVSHNDWGGWLFLNGMLSEDGRTTVINDGKTDNQGLNLSGACELHFYARGEKGGEKAEFFTCGFGDGDPSVIYPDSSHKISLGVVTLSDHWKEYIIDLTGNDMSYTVLGFGFVLSGSGGTGRKVFYLDDICFTGTSRVADNGFYLLRSYTTNNPFVHNAAFTYDNALAALAFISDGKEKEASLVLDALAFAVCIYIDSFCAYIHF